MTSSRPADAREEAVEISLTGKALLKTPLLNKESAFTEEERREFGLAGLLSPHVSTMDEQLCRTCYVVANSFALWLCARKKVGRRTNEFVIT